MVRRLPNLIFIVSLTLLVGCWGDQMKVVMDSAVNGQIKMMEAKAKIDKEKRQEKYSIEGTIKSVVMREKEIPDPDPKNLQKKEEPTEKGVKIEMVQPKITVKFCVVVFADGREKEFDSVPSMPLDVGTYYRIEYNGMGEITGANPVKK